MGFWDSLEGMVDWINPMLSPFYRLVTQPIFWIVIISVVVIIVAVMLSFGIRVLMVFILNWLYGA